MRCSNPQTAAQRLNSESIIERQTQFQWVIANSTTNKQEKFKSENQKGTQVRKEREENNNEWNDGRGKWRLHCSRTIDFWKCSNTDYRHSTLTNSNAHFSYMLAVSFHFQLQQQMLSLNISLTHISSVSWFHMVIVPWYLVPSAQT